MSDRTDIDGFKVALLKCCGIDADMLESAIIDLGTSGKPISITTTQLLMPSNLSFDDFEHVERRYEVTARLIDTGHE